MTVSGRTVTEPESETILCTVSEAINSSALANRRPGKRVVSIAPRRWRLNRLGEAEEQNGCCADTDPDSRASQEHEPRREHASGEAEPGRSGEKDPGGRAVRCPTDEAKRR
jgi:hypothetical protein